MGKVWILAGVLVVLGGAATFVLLYAKIAQKMFSSSNKKEIDK